MHLNVVMIYNFLYDIQHWKYKDDNEEHICYRLDTCLSHRNYIKLTNVIENHICSQAAYLKHGHHLSITSEPISIVIK